MSRITPTVTVNLDKERHLRYDLNALVDIEEATGKPLSEIFTDTANMSMKNFRILLWAGLKSEDPALTREQLGAMIDVSIFAELKDAIGQAVFASQPDQATGEPKNEESPSDGENSGPTDA